MRVSQYVPFVLAALVALSLPSSRDKRNGFASVHALKPSAFGHRATERASRRDRAFLFTAPSSSSSAPLAVANHERVGDDVVAGIDGYQPFSYNGSKTATNKIASRTMIDRASGSPAETSTTATAVTTRRRALTRAANSISLLGTAVFSRPRFSTAMEAAKAKAVGVAAGMVSERELAALLNPIPTFAIVDPDGVPYFVVGEDAKLTSYFFTSFGEARRILDVAIKSSDKVTKEARKELLAKKRKGAKGGGSVALTKEEEEEIGTNPWKIARITSVPLDLAVSLASRGNLAGAYFRLAPPQTDVEDALSVDGSDDLPEGKVPLFYVDGMTLPSSGIIPSSSMTTSPLYFRKSELVDEWKRQQKRKGSSIAASSPTSSDPEIKVTELFATITEMVSPGGTDEELRSITFVPPKESRAKAAQSLKGEKEPFRLGQRLIVL